MAELAQLVANGLLTGGMLALAAVGVTMVLEVLRVLHVAHGDTLMVGAYLSLGLANWSGSLLVGTLLSIVATALLCWGLDIALWRPLRRKGAGMIARLLTSIGLALVMRHVVLVVAGSATRSYDFNRFTSVVIGPVRLSLSQAVAAVVIVTTIIVLAVLFARTTIGRSIRGLSDDADLAAVTGIPVERTIAVIWLVSGGLAALAGTLQGMIANTFDPNFGFEILLPVFAAVVLGGIGSVTGALAGGLVIGLVMEVSTWSALLGGVPSRYKLVVAFAGLVVMLLVRPNGLLGRVQLR